MDDDKSHPAADYPVTARGSGEKDLPTYDVSNENGETLILENVDGLKRRLSGRQIQMVTIGGSIGTALFVSIGSGLTAGGPGSLFIAFFIYSCFLALVNNCMAEMAVFMPVSGSFVRMGSKWVDEAFGFMLGWNFFLYGEFGVNLGRGRKTSKVEEVITNEGMYLQRPS
jgi:amino acid transporter